MQPPGNDILKFLSQYNEEVQKHAIQLRKNILKALPGITEQLDMPAKMIAYSYGQKYIEMVGTIVPSKKGLKLGFYKGIDLPDPESILEGAGKISRYVQIKSLEQINSVAMKNLLTHALENYRERMKEK